jgi:hypothetical protein
MTPDAIRAIMARAEAATEGPWSTESYRMYTSGDDMSGAEPAHECVNAPGDGGLIADCSFRRKESADNTRFIAHARDDVPALCEALLRLHDADPSYFAAILGLEFEQGAVHK